MARLPAAAAAILVLLSEPSSGIPLRQEFKTRRHHQHGGLLTAEIASKYPEQWFEQRLTHYNSSDDRTFKQLYFVNLDHYKAGGPLLLTIGGEGPLTAGYVAGHLANVELAKELNGAVVALEHRFYGKSQPFNNLDTEHLKYLTSQQALSDLAHFQFWFVHHKMGPPMRGSPVFCMGGSYPGNLAAWYRLKFPDRTNGCWSSSAPVQAQEVWPGFGEMVWKAVATDAAGATDFSVPVKLYVGYEQIANLVQDGTVEGFAALQKAFNVCPGTLVSQQDRDNFESTVSTAVGSVMQYNNTMEPKLSAVRDIIIKASTPLDAVLSVSKFLNLTQDGGECTDNSIGSFYQLLGNTTLPADGSGNAARTWTWQTCNEFGYFQTATGVFGSPTMYTRGTSSPSMWQQVCSEIFGISPSDVSARIAATNRYYGGKDLKPERNHGMGPPRRIDHVLFSNGELDGWSLLGVTSVPANTHEVYVEVAPLGSHCVGLYSPMDGEVPGAESIRSKALALFKKWSFRPSVSAGVPLVI